MEMEDYVYDLRYQLYHTPSLGTLVMLTLTPYYGTLSIAHERTTTLAGLTLLPELSSRTFPLLHHSVQFCEGERGERPSGERVSSLSR